MWSVCKPDLKMPIGRRPRLEVQTWGGPSAGMFFLRGASCCCSFGSRCSYGHLGTRGLAARKVRPTRDYLSTCHFWEIKHSVSYWWNTMPFLVEDFLPTVFRTCTSTQALIIFSITALFKNVNGYSSSLMSLAISLRCANSPSRGTLFSS